MFALQVASRVRTNENWLEHWPRDKDKQLLDPPNLLHRTQCSSLCRQIKCFERSVFSVTVYLPGLRCGRSSWFIRSVVTRQVTRISWHIIHRSLFPSSPCTIYCLLCVLCPSATGRSVLWLIPLFKLPDGAIKFVCLNLVFCSLRLIQNSTLYASKFLFSEELFDYLKLNRNYVEYNIWFLFAKKIVNCRHFDKVNFRARNDRQNIEQVLNVLSTLCFRFDLGRPTRAFALRACTLQNGAVAVIFYFLSLIISLSIVNIDDKINLSQTRENLWDTDEVSCHRCCRTMWMGLNWQIS